VIRVNRRIAGGTGSEKEILVLVGNVELHGEALRRCREHARHWEASRRLQLTGARGPDDRIDLGLDDLPRKGLKGELRLVPRLDLMQLVLAVERDHAAGRLHQCHYRSDRERGHVSARPELQVDDVAVAR